MGAEADPVIRFRPYSRNKPLPQEEYERHVQYIRSLNSPPLSVDQQRECVAAWREAIEQQLPATCGEPAVVECNQASGCCSKTPAPGLEAEISCDCVPNPADPSLRCCTLPPVAPDPNPRVICDYVWESVPDPSCRRQLNAPAYCESGQDASNDPPLGQPLNPSLWTICPYSSIRFTGSSVVYNCKGNAVVPLNATDALKALVQEQIVQGLGVDAAATGLDGVGALLAHFLMPGLFKPIIL